MEIINLSLRKVLKNSSANGSTALRVIEPFWRNLLIFTECVLELKPQGPIASVSLSAPQFRICGAWVVLNSFSVSIPPCQIRLKSMVRIECDNIFRMSYSNWLLLITQGMFGFYYWQVFKLWVLSSSEAHRNSERVPQPGVGKNGGLSGCEKG